MPKYALSGNRVLHTMDWDRNPPNQDGNAVVFDIAGYAKCGIIMFSNELTDDPTGVDIGIGKARRKCKNCEKKSLTESDLEAISKARGFYMEVDDES